MMKYVLPQIYAVIFFQVIIVAFAVYAAVLRIRNRCTLRRRREAEKQRYMEKLEKERNFYRLQWETAGVDAECIIEEIIRLAKDGKE